MKKILFFSLAIVLSLSFVGCRTAQILNIPEQAVVSKKNITNEDIFNSIVRAGASLGWIVKKENDNTAIGTLHLRSHTAVVTIKFDTKSYSIHYKASVDLKYNKAENSIHSNYNGWITNLNNKIQVELSLL